ncbi:MAG: hypothetical protein K2X86_09855 [Cytophagaceae bacterium]|nr:hypothetical protein [Cytophagaceae bacterium]
MKNKMKLLLGFIFSFGLFLTSNAQSDSSGGLPAEDQIVCKQVSENVFDCTVEGEFEDMNSEKDVIDDAENNNDSGFDLNQEDSIKKETPEIRNENRGEPSIEQNLNKDNSDTKKQKEPVNLLPGANEALKPEIKVEC